MTNAVIRWCLKNPLLVALAMAGLALGGYYAIEQVPVDAIPDIGEKQALVYADWPGRSPRDVDDQVTYPLASGLAGTPGVKTIRSMSGFGFAMVFVIFDDRTDYYWGRSRVLERLNVLLPRMPPGVTPALGPDGTALGQVFWYTLEGEGFDLAELRSIQDWYVRLQLGSVEGVSEVASVGGFVRQYQVDVHPDKLRAYGLGLPAVVEAVRRSNLDIGARVVEKNGIEFFIRGVGFLKSADDIARIVLRESGGTAVRVADVATVSLGPDFRRGSLDKGGVEAVGGVVLMRYGENARHVVARIKERLARIEPGFPTKTLADGRPSRVRLVPFYDRSDIVRETLGTLKDALTQEALLAAVVVLVFLLHLRSTLTVVVTLPLSVAACFVLMRAAGVDSNIMSLAGLAIAIGDVADMGIIMSENIYRHVADPRPGRSYAERVYDGATEVGGAVITAVSNTLVSFIPVFFLADQEGRLFRPLAYTKTFAIGASTVLAVTVVPVMALLLFRSTRHWARRTVGGLALAGGVAAGFVTRLVVARAFGLGPGRGWFIGAAAGVIVGLAIARALRESLLPVDKNPVSRLVTRLYEPALRWVLAHKAAFLALPAVILFAGLTVWLGIKTTLAPVAWALNLAAHEPLSDELRREMYVPAGQRARRPRVEFAHLRWQRLREADGRTRSRFLWRRQDPSERRADVARGVQVVADRRILPGLGREFMPPLDEGSFLYMPSLLPQGGFLQAVEVNARQDLAIASVPEVASVVGKVGRAETALDPAPVGMIESIIILKPEGEWRRVPVPRWFSAAPRWLKAPLAAVWPEDRPITKGEILAELQEKTAIPGVLPTFLQPIQTRLVMLQTGFRAMMGVKVYGADLDAIERVCVQMESILSHVPGAADVVADRAVGKPYLEFEIDRDRIARYGLSVEEVQSALEAAVGGVVATQTVEGRERSPVQVRYAREFREDLPDLGRILVSVRDGAGIPLSQVVRARAVAGPQEIKGERGLRVGYVTLNARQRDEVSVVEDGEAALRAAVREGRLVLPPGCYWEWSGQFENQQRAMARLRILVPLCLAVMLVMLYTGFVRWWVGPLIFLGVLVSASGGFLMLAWWGANLSVAVWVGFLVLFGVADDDGVVMATYLEGLFRDARFRSRQEIRDRVVEAGLRRIRPCLMTTFTTVVGLAPVFWTHGRGSDVMQPMAIPSVGGMAVSLVTLFIVPCVFCAIEEWKWSRAAGLPEGALGGPPTP